VGRSTNKLSDCRETIGREKAKCQEKDFGVFLVVKIVFLLRILRAGSGMRHGKLIYVSPKRHRGTRWA
jgi:hypothetical protein